MELLTINAGSTSIKLDWFEASENRLHHRMREQLSGEGDETPQGYLRKFHSRTQRTDPEVVVHRVVHGGDFRDSRPVDDTVAGRIAALGHLAPLHNPVAARWLGAAREAFPGSRHVAAFDTAFYAELPPQVHYALPADLVRRLSIRRYGFHGLAHRGLWEQWHDAGQEPAMQRVITLQLGGGASITAIRDGKALDTSMGFSPSEGLMMATRTGDLDPGIPLYLQREAGFDTAALDRLINKESGLAGVSGISEDMRTLLESREPSAEQAVEMYCYRIRKYIGAYMAVLGGVDALVFGGGIGENAWQVRERILEPFGWAGIVLDAEANRRTVGKPGRISASASSVDIWTFPSDEAEQLAREGLRFA